MTGNSSSNRRRFLGQGVAAGAALGVALAADDAAHATDAAVTARDVAILRFLSAAEQIETDLWQQYTEVALGNPGFRDALEAIDEDLGQYSADTTEDERSHGRFINAFLVAIGKQPVDLRRFATIMPPAVTGMRQIGRLTNLTDLTIDTSYYRRYRGVRNPDFGASFGQIATIVGQAAIPTSNSLNARALGGVARVAAFHFPSIEQGGTSLYDQFVPFVTNREVLRIVSSIYATEAIHYAIFRDALGGVTAFNSGDGKLVVPNLTDGDNKSGRVMPRPCEFLRADLPPCSVIRPSSQAKAGALAAATALTNSNLFKGQSPAFFATVTALARAADGDA